MNPGKFFRNNALIISAYLLICVISLFFILNYEKHDIHIYLNQFVGNFFINIFFFYITYLGDGTVGVLLLLFVLFVNVRAGIYTTFSFICAAATTNILKYFFFDDVNRPSFIFQYIKPYPLKLVEGVHVNIHNSFPSGHATQAFAILMCLVFVSSNQWAKVGFFMLALLTSLSRVYLSQHWLSDITAGSVIGTIWSSIFYFTFIQKNRFHQLDVPLLALRKP